VPAPDDHWGRRPREWAELAEPSNEPLFATVLDRLIVGHRTRLLDIGCGSGYAAAMAAALGATVTGIDITPELIEIARERVPSATFVTGGMDVLPFDAGVFDAAVAFNAFQFADVPAQAVREAARVVRPGGLVAATTFAEPERNESTALHLALEPLRQGAAVRRRRPSQQGAAVRRRRPSQQGAAVDAGHLPYELSAPGGLQALLAAASLEPVESGEVPLGWEHPNGDEAVRAILASAGGAMAIEAAGEAKARGALERAIVPFTRPDGTVLMRNVFRYEIARRGDC
jgi:SAM-dependent methyltransferase